MHCEGQRSLLGIVSKSKSQNHKVKYACLTFLVVLLLVIDQTIKVSVKIGMCLHESIRVTDWFYISFIENNGMAYGMSFIPKPLLTSFRLIACIFLVWYIRRQLLSGARMVWLVMPVQRATS